VGTCCRIHSASAMARLRSRSGAALRSAATLPQFCEKLVGRDEKGIGL
jgi:hypothetical protein